MEDGDYSRVVINYLMTCISHILGNSPVNRVQRACRGYYTIDECLTAKELLWRVGDKETLGPLINSLDDWYKNFG